jgi:hypothetical protein
MLPDPLHQYLEKVESAIRNLQGVYVERYQEEILTAERVNLRIRMRFSQGFLLELNEAVVAEGGTIKHLGYRYHFQDERNRLVFRYDNTPHFPELKNFPHHRHSEGGVTGYERPSISRVLDEATGYSDR